MKWPLVPFNEYIVSGPVLPNFYWDVYSQEQRIKEICKRLNAMIEYLELMMEALNDLNSRVSYFEAELDLIRNQINDLINMIEGWENRISNLERNLSTLMNLFNQLSSIVSDNYNELLGMITALEDRVNALELALDNIDISVEGAVENNVVFFGPDGSLKDSGISIVDRKDQFIQYPLKQIAVFDESGNIIKGNFTSTGNEGSIVNSGSYDNLVSGQTLTKILNPELRSSWLHMPFQDDNFNQLTSWIPIYVSSYYNFENHEYEPDIVEVLYNGEYYYSNVIHSYSFRRDLQQGDDDKYKVSSIIQYGWFDNSKIGFDNNKPKLLYRYADNYGYSEWSNWFSLGSEYLRELTPAEAKATSLLNPDALVYVPEEEGV